MHMLPDALLLILKFEEQLMASEMVAMRTASLAPPQHDPSRRSSDSKASWTSW